MRSRCRSSSVGAASAVWASTSRTPTVVASSPRSPSVPTYSSRTRGRDAMDGFGLGLRRSGRGESPARLRVDLRLRAGRARPRPSRDGQHRAGRVRLHGPHGVRRRAAVAGGHRRSPTTPPRRSRRSGSSRHSTNANGRVEASSSTSPCSTSCSSYVWDEAVDYYAERGLPLRTGNADARGAPINTYRCADGWVSVTGTSDAQWRALCERMRSRPSSPTSIPINAHGRRRRAMSTRPSKRGAARALRPRSKRPCWRLACPRVRCVRRWKLRPIRNSRPAACWNPSGTPRRPNPAASSARACRSRSRAGPSTLHQQKCSGRARDAILRERVGCDDDELKRLHEAGVIS